MLTKRRSAQPVRVRLDDVLAAHDRREESRLAALPLRDDYGFCTHARAVLAALQAGASGRARYVLATLKASYGDGCLGEAAAVWTDRASLDTGTRMKVPAGCAPLEVLVLAAAHTTRR
jgi:hypothetical protein